MFDVDMHRASEPRAVLTIASANLGAGMQFASLFSTLVTAVVATGLLLFLWRSRALDDAFVFERLVLPLAIGLLLVFPGLQYLMQTTRRLVRRTTESVLDTCFSAPMPELEPTLHHQIIVRSSKSGSEETDYVFDEVFGIIPRAVIEDWTRAEISRRQQPPVQRRLPPVRAFPPCSSS